MTEIEKIEALLRGLLKGEFSSLTIGFNDDHACNYVNAIGYRDEYGQYGDDSRITWVSEEEKERAMNTNSVWTIQWYPHTPVGFCCVGASSLKAVIDYISEMDE